MPTLVNPNKNNNGKFFKISLFIFKIYLKVNGNNINQTRNHLKNDKEKGGIFSIKAILPTLKLPAQNNVAHTNIKYALVFFFT